MAHKAKAFEGKETAAEERLEHKELMRQSHRGKRGSSRKSKRGSTRY